MNVVSDGTKDVEWGNERLIVQATQILENATMFWLACHVTWNTA